MENNVLATGFYSSNTYDVLKAFVDSLHDYYNSKKETSNCLCIRKMVVARDYDNQILLKFDNWHYPENKIKFIQMFGAMFKRWIRHFVLPDEWMNSWNRKSDKSFHIKPIGYPVQVKHLYCIYDKLLNRRYEYKYSHDVILDVIGQPEDMVIAEMKRLTAEKIDEINRQLTQDIEKANHDRCAAIDKARDEINEKWRNTRAKLCDEADAKIKAAKDELTAFINHSSFAA